MTIYSFILLVFFFNKTGQNQWNKTCCIVEFLAKWTVNFDKIVYIIKNDSRLYTNGNKPLSIVSK